MNILRAALVAAIALLPAPSAAQPAVSSSLEAGWTSNVQGTPDGAGSAYLTHTHAIGLAADGLRGAISVEQTRYADLWRENDWTGTIALDGQTPLSPAATLRGSLALSYAQEGQSLPTLAGPIHVLSPTLSATAFLRAETLMGSALIGLDIAHAAQRPGETVFEGNILPQTRTAPRTDTLTAGLDVVQPITPTAALSARAQYKRVLIAPDEQAEFGRLPVSLVRLGGGIEIGAGAPTGILLRGGIDAIVPDAAISPLLVPHAEAQARLQFSDALALHTSLTAGADVEEPADGLADWRLSARGSMVFTPLPRLSAEAALFTSLTRSPALNATIETEAGAELIARWAAIDGLTLETLARYRQVAGPSGALEETRLALRISAAI